MEVTNKKQSMIRQLCCVIMAIIAVVIVYAFVPRFEPMPVGVVLPTKNARSPISVNNVSIYNSTPMTAVTVGNINLEMAYNNLSDSNGAENKILDKAKQLAAKVGGNGVLIKRFDYTPPGSVMSKSQLRYIFYGTAVYIPPDNFTGGLE